jgi:hypothetical protein
MKRCHGLGLLELMISLALSLWLLWVLVEQLVQVKREIIQVSASMNRSLELQWLTDLLRSRVRGAGYTPCVRVDHLLAVDTRSYPESLAAVEWQAQPLSKCTLRRMGNAISPVLRQINSYEIVIKGPAVTLKRPIMIADCRHAEIHTQAELVTTPDGVHVLLAEPLQFNYQPPVYYAEWVTESFFMRARALYYQHHRVDQLSTQVVDFNVEISTHDHHTWVKWLLHRDDGQEWPLVTRVRSA